MEIVRNSIKLSKIEVFEAFCPNLEALLDDLVLFWVAKIFRKWSESGPKGNNPGFDLNA